MLILNIVVLVAIYIQVRASRATNNLGSAGETVIKRALLFVLAYIIQFTPLTLFTVITISGGTVIPLSLLPLSSSFPSSL